jgi:hypothetical protein
MIDLGVCEDSLSVATATCAGAGAPGDDRRLDTTIDLGGASSVLRHQEENLEAADRQLNLFPLVTIDLGACEDFAVMAGAAATCAGAANCDIIGGYIGVSPGTSITGNFQADILAPNADSKVLCATDGLAAWNAGTAILNANTMLAEMGGLTFTPGVYAHEVINIALANPKVYLDAQGDPNAIFIFNVGTTLTTCANSETVLVNGARKENVFWVLGTALTMGADSILVGNVLAGSAITIGTNGKILGRAIAQTAVTCETHCTVDSTATSVQITATGEAYGHHGACQGFNACGDAATCALAACKDQGYTELVSYGEAKPCTEFNVCHLFYGFVADQCAVQYNWGNWCAVAGVTDIVCKNPGGPCTADGP